MSCHPCESFILKYNVPSCWLQECPYLHTWLNGDKCLTWAGLWKRSWTHTYQDVISEMFRRWGRKNPLLPLAQLLLLNFSTKLSASTSPKREGLSIVLHVLNYFLLLQSRWKARKICQRGGKLLWNKLTPMSHIGTGSSHWMITCHSGLKMKRSRFSSPGG